MAAGHPFVVVHDFVADGGGVSVAGVDDGFAGQLAQPARDRLEDCREVGVRPSRRTRSALEQGVPAEHRSEFWCVPADRPWRVAGRVQGANLGSGDRQRLLFADRAEVLVRVGHPPQHIVGWMQQHGRVERIAEFRCDRDMVVVAVGAHHGDHVATADGVDDRARIVCSVEDDNVVVVADDPDVVVDFPTATVEFEGAVGDYPLYRSAVHFITTTDRSTSPACILWKASSMSSRPMRSETNFSSGSRPCR